MCGCGVAWVSDDHRAPHAVRGSRSVSSAPCCVVAAARHDHLSSPYAKGSHVFFFGGYAWVAMFAWAYRLVPQSWSIWSIWSITVLLLVVLLAWLGSGVPGTCLPIIPMNVALVAHRPHAVSLARCDAPMHHNHASYRVSIPITATGVNYHPCTVVLLQGCGVAALWGSTIGIIG